MADARLLSDQVWAILDAIPAVNAFDGEFTKIDETGARVQVTPPADEDGRVHAYAVFYPSAGWAHALLACGGVDSLDWGFQVTCAGGDRTRALWCIGKVRDALTGARIDDGTGQLLEIREVGDPGPIRRDDDISPVRFYLPLDFALNA